MKSKHKWIKNTCITCGVQRKFNGRKDYLSWLYFHPILTNNLWIKDRPDCK